MSIYHYDKNSTGDNDSQQGYRKQNENLSRSLIHGVYPSNRDDCDMSIKVSITGVLQLSGSPPIMQNATEGIHNCTRYTILPETQ